jgi:hypothetical protein
VSIGADVCPLVPRSPASAVAGVVQAVSPERQCRRRQTFGGCKDAGQQGSRGGEGGVPPGRRRAGVPGTVAMAGWTRLPALSFRWSLSITPKGDFSSPGARVGVLRCKACRRKFTVTVGTAFDSSHVSLNKWLLAIAHLGRSGNGLSGAKLDRLLGVSPPTARFLAHRVRHALAASRSRTSRRAPPEHLSSHRASLEHAGGLILSSAASGASRPSGKTDSKSTDRGRRSATKDGGSPGRVSFEEAVACMLGQTPRRGPGDARQRPGRIGVERSGQSGPAMATGA